MMHAQQKAAAAAPKKMQRSAYDRRAGNDRRSNRDMEYTGMERRSRQERRLVLKEQRLGWVRDTMWSSINLDLLR
jgi:hypothetical protein